MAKIIVLLALSLQLFIIFAASKTQEKTNSSGICYLPVYERKAQNPIKTCPDQDIIDEYECFPQCEEGYSANTLSDSYDSSDSDPYVAPPVNFYNSFCWQDCPAGFDDVPGGCAHATAFGKGLNYATEKECLNWGKAKECELCTDTENNYTSWYAVSSCGTCIPYCPITECPPGMTQNGSVCMKHFYNRTALFTMECPEGTEPVSYSDEEFYGAVCYPVPHTGFSCTGPVCTGSCPEGWHPCSSNICVHESKLCDNAYFAYSEDLGTGFAGMEGNYQLLTEADLAKIPHELTTVYYTLPVQPICPYKKF